MPTVLRAAPLIAALVLVVSGCDSTVTGNPRAGGDRGPLSWGPDLTESQLAGVLLDAARIKQIMASSAIVVYKNYDQLPGGEGDQYSNPTCAGAVFNTIEVTYHRSGYLAVRGSQLSEPGASFKHYVDEGVVSFPGGRDARKFLSTAQDVWRRCVGKHVVYTTPDGKATTWTERAPVTIGGVTAAVVDKEAGDGYTCAHGITSKSNVVIDVSACSYSMSEEGGAVAGSIVNSIADKFPT
ncbi:sensor domain-containing protein [Mycobacterium sp.]|uniref:sensor domain-containing protein n=1 Tax=Mycobacterium sp. TaxID=1785 RepID=UPI003C7211E9